MRMLMRKQIMLGLIGAASLLTMATTSYAAIIKPPNINLPNTTYCLDGEVMDIGAGYQNEGVPAGPYRTIELKCNDSDGPLELSYIVYPSNAVDLDGIMATALTAMTEGYHVSYTLYPYKDVDAVISLNTAK
jgi:hypothetical protein